MAGSFTATADVISTDILGIVSEGTVRALELLVQMTVSAVEHSLLMEEMARRMKAVDVYIAPTSDDDNELLTNLTGHPAVVVPNGFNEKGSPTSIVFIGGLYEEAKTEWKKALSEGTLFQFNPVFYAIAKK